MIEVNPDHIPDYSTDSAEMIEVNPDPNRQKSAYLKAPPSVGQLKLSG